MEEPNCNKAIKIVTALAIIIFMFGASAILEKDSLQKENAQLKEEASKVFPSSSTGLYFNGESVEPIEVWVNYNRNPFGICYGTPSQTNRTKWKWTCGLSISPPATKENTKGLSNSTAWGGGTATYSTHNISHPAQNQDVDDAIQKALTDGDISLRQGNKICLQNSKYCYLAFGDFILRLPKNYSW